MSGKGTAKHSFAEGPAFGAAVFDLLDLVFPGIRKAAQRAQVLGASWESVSTPYVIFDGDRVVSHVGVIPLRLVAMGKTVPVGSVHAVSTHPDYRRRGLYRRIMEEVLEDCAGRYETLILSTENPEYYEPFGFRHLQEHQFTLAAAGAPGRGGFRRLNPADGADAALLHRLLESREPVSRVVGVVDEKAIFFVNETHRPLYYAQDLDALVCLELEGTRLRLHDVVAPVVPPVEALLERIAEPVTEVVIRFGADRVAPAAVAQPYVLDDSGPSYLMARGPFAAEGEPFTLPRSART